MKIFILIFSIFAFSLVKGQESILFQDNALPNRIYTSKMNSIITSSQKIENSRSTPSKINRNLSNMNVEGDIEMEVTMETSNTQNGCIPFVSKITKSKILKKYNGKMAKADPFMEGSNIYGCFDVQSNEKKIDSITNSNLDSIAKLALKNKMEKNANLFPNRPIRIGESFNKDSVETFPIMAAEDQEFVVTTQYTLIKIEKGVAFLKSKLIFRLKNANEQIEILPTTNGTGSIQWDIENHCITDERKEFTLDTRVLGEFGFIISSKITNKSRSHVKIEERIKT